MSRINDILTEQRKRSDEAQADLTKAQERKNKADEVIGKLEAAAQALASAEAAADEALRNANIQPEVEAKDNNDISTMIAMLAVLGLVVGIPVAYVLGQNTNKGKINSKPENQTGTGIYYYHEESGEYLPFEQQYYTYDENGNAVPCITEFYEKDENGKFILCEGMTSEDHSQLVTELQNAFVSRSEEFNGIFKEYSDDPQLLESFVNALNLSSIITEPDLVKEIRNNGDLGEDAGNYVLLNNADRVRDAILTYNIQQYIATGSTEKFIDLSDFMYDDNDQIDLVIEMEWALDDIAKHIAEGKNEEANQAIDELFTRLESGDLHNVDNSVGYFVVRYIATMLSDIMMNPGMNGSINSSTQVAITEENKMRAEILKGSVCDDFDNTKEGGVANLYYRNLKALLDEIIKEYEESLQKNQPTANNSSAKRFVRKPTYMSRYGNRNYTGKRI